MKAMQISKYSVESSTWGGGGVVVVKGGRQCNRTSFVNFKKLYRSVSRVVSVQPSVYLSSQLINLSSIIYLIYLDACLHLYLREREEITGGIDEREIECKRANQKYTRYFYCNIWKEKGMRETQMKMGECY
jgi:hypothetical protein